MTEQPQDLNERERAFCRRVVAGSSTAEAAIAVGYPANDANIVAKRFMKQPGIRAEIVRLAEVGRRVVADMLGSSTGAAAVEDGAKGAGPTKATPPDRVSQQQALVTAMQVALGKLPQRRTLVLTRRGRYASPQRIVVNVEMMEANPRKVARLAVLMSKELDRMEAEARASGAKPPASPAKPPVSRVQPSTS